MNIKEALIYSNNKLKKLDPNFVEGSILLSFCLGKPKEYLYTHPEQRLTKTQIKNFKKLIARRLKKEPIAYLIKQKEFYDLKFYVDKNVLIPRPETEIVIEEILNIIKKYSTKILRLTNRESRFTICDIGTGSGCISITLAKLLPNAKITAVDISAKALAVAKKNAKKYRVFNKIKFIQGNLLKPFFTGSVLAPASTPRFNVAIANLPYLTKKELKNVPFEPRQALFGGKNGLEIIEKFLKQVKNYLNNKSIIFVEISPAQILKVKKLLKKYLPDKKYYLAKDLAGKNRVIKIF